MSRVWLAIVATGTGTYAMRASFLLAADRLARVPRPVERLLRQIPPAALASLVLPALLRHEGSLDLASPRLLAGAVAAVVAWRTRNVAATLVVGMGLLVLLDTFWSV